MLILKYRNFLFDNLHQEVYNMFNNYDYQKEANITSLLEDERYEERKSILGSLVVAFEEEKVQYAVGCSFNLFLRGIVDEFNDFDFIVDSKSICKVREIMEGLGAELIATGGNGYCESDYYFHYQLGKTDIDIISGFRILTYGTKIYYAYNKAEVEYAEIYDDVTLSIPMIPLEELFLLYAMMEGWQPRRRYKRVLIAEALKENHLMFSGILRKSLDSSLPKWIKRKVREILNKK